MPWRKNDVEHDVDRDRLRGLVVEHVDNGLRLAGGDVLAVHRAIGIGCAARAEVGHRLLVAVAEDPLGVAAEVDVARVVRAGFGLEPVRVVNVRLLVGGLRQVPHSPHARVDRQQEPVARGQLEVHAVEVLSGRRRCTARSSSVSFSVVPAGLGTKRSLRRASPFTRPPPLPGLWSCEPWCVCSGLFLAVLVALLVLFALGLCRGRRLEGCSKRWRAAGGRVALLASVRARGSRRRRPIRARRRHPRSRTPRPCAAGRRRSTPRRPRCRSRRRPSRPRSPCRPRSASRAGSARAPRPVCASRAVRLPFMSVV